MHLIQRGRKMVMAFGLALVLAIASIGLTTPAWSMAEAASLSAVSHLQLATADSELGRRVEATQKKVEGQVQRSYGDAVDSPANQIEGTTKKLTGEMGNRMEDARGQVKDFARDTEQESESLIDRVKDFFD